MRLLILLFAVALAAPAFAGELEAQQSFIDPLRCDRCNSTLAAGITTFGVAYAGSLVLLVSTEHSLFSFSNGSLAAALFTPVAATFEVLQVVPILGPLLAAKFYWNSNSVLSRLALADCAAQATGFVVTIVGQRMNREWELAHVHQLAVVPLAAPQGAGMSLTGHF